jgi:predicted enzyme related to lactoylglutathione lyase
VISIEVCIDVPELAKGVAFYGAAFGFAKVAEPYPGVAVLKAGETLITLLQKAAGSKPSSNTSDVRRYERHWTPVHIDFHVDDVKAALEKAIAAGAIREQFYDSDQHGSIAFCADPFGNGFCLLQRKADR